MIKSIQIETPPTMKDDRYARRILLEHEDGRLEMVDNSPLGHSKLIRGLLAEVDYSELPCRFVLEKSVPVKAAETPKQEKETVKPVKDAVKKKAKGLPTG